MSGRDGRPAFPRVEPASGGQGPTIYFGMTLRDYFAGQAIGPLIGKAHDLANAAPLQIEAMAKAAYYIADAMLAERAKERA